MASHRYLALGRSLHLSVRILCYAMPQWMSVMMCARVQNRHRDRHHVHVIQNSRFHVCRPRYNVPRSREWAYVSWITLYLFVHLPH